VSFIVCAVLWAVFSSKNPVAIKLYNNNNNNNNNNVTDSRKGGHCYLHGNEGNNSFNRRNLATASYAGNQFTARKRSDNRE
jgi:hypothetical protein